MQAWRKDETFAISGESAHNFDKKVAWGMQFDFIKCFIRICRKEGPSRVINLLARKRKNPLRIDQFTGDTSMKLSHCIHTPLQICVWTVF